ncbi:hypothetical protein K2X40_05340 [Candidatus Babeliales bacterium]|nr:hypothetical protein [Candidatus Babeliales bacterium]
MSKKIIFSSIFTLIVGITCLHAFNFDELFKGVDFDKLAQDMEKALSEKKSGPTRPVGNPNWGQPFGPRPTQKPALSTVAENQEDEKDNRTLFLESLIINKDPQAKPADETAKVGTYVFSHAKREAFRFYMNHFVDLLKEVERKIDSSENFSPEFKVIFSDFKTNIDEITVAHGIINDHKMYQRVFFLPQFEELRKKIVDACERLEQLNKRIVIDLAQEEATTKTENKLQELAQTPAVPLPNIKLEPQETKAGKRRGILEKALKPLADDEQVTNPTSPQFTVGE